jgi:uncharacterized membrane protein (UPF0127 family)
MKFPIDVVYVDRAWRVVRLEPGMPAWRLGPVVQQATCIVELPAGVIRDSATAVGDQLTYAVADSIYTESKMKPADSKRQSM